MKFQVGDVFEVRDGHDRGKVMAVDFGRLLYHVKWEVAGNIDHSEAFLEKECTPIQTDPFCPSPLLPPTPAPTAGFKADAGKDRWDLAPFRAFRAIIKIITFGANGKYKDLPPDNWRRLPNAKERYFAAAMRHLCLMRTGEWTDQESGMPHLWHALCCLAFLVELYDGES